MKRYGHLPMSKLAYQAPVFMESRVARPLRILAEYIDPINRLRKASVADTIVMFGSARIQPRDRSEAQLKRLQKTLRGKRDKHARMRLTAARSIVEMSRYYEEARELSRRITGWSMTLGTNPK